MEKTQRAPGGPVDARIGPELVEIDLTWEDIDTQLAAYHALMTAVLHDVADPYLPEFRINGTLCSLTHSVVGGWYLVEAIGPHAPNGFYLLPGSRRQLDRYNGKVPYIEFDGPADKDNESPADVRRACLQAMTALVTVIIDPSRSDTGSGDN